MEFRFSSSNTSFPDTLRSAGHKYNGKLYPAVDHYSDSSVKVIVPPGFTPGKKIDLVFWFHGWYNNIDSSIKVFHLRDQFLAAGKNAVLVIPEGAVKAPDSYGGKLEQPGRFNNLIQDVLQQLKERSLLAEKTTIGKVVLAGHSGAYRVMAHILEFGGVEVQEVLLFDGLYGQVDKFEKWISGNSSRHFIHLYTSDGGGTDEVSIQFMDKLKIAGLHFESKEEEFMALDDKLKDHILFIKSKRGHNEILSDTDWFFRVLKNSHYLR